jgi:hypothetical protein
LTISATDSVNGSDYIVQVESGADETVTVTAAVYDAAGRLADSKTAPNVAIAAGAPPVTRTFEGITVPDGGFVKFYFWDSATYAPRCDPQ